MKMQQKQTFAQGAGLFLRGQCYCLLVVRSVLWCVQLVDNIRTTRKTRRNTSQDEGRDKAGIENSRPQRGGGFSLNLYLPGVSRRSGVISHDVSRYILISYPISCDITRCDTSRSCIHIPNFGTDIVCRLNIAWYRTLFFAQLGARRE